MNFFDFIDKCRDTSRLADDIPFITKLKPVVASTPSAARVTQKRNRTSPEKLSFLQPCSLCGGRKFIYGRDGRFYCIVCQPGIHGTLVNADAPDRSQEKSVLESTTNDDHETKTKKGKLEKQYFMTALPWIRIHLDELLAYGWTRPALFKRGKNKWPVGSWGVAWLSVWSKEKVKVNINPKSGTIRFTFTANDRRIITQTAYPPSHLTNSTKDNTE